MVEQHFALGPEIKHKLIAWWNGYEAPPLRAFNNYKRDFLRWWNGADPVVIPLDVPAVRPRSVKAPRAKTLEISARCAVSQALWGEGNLTPGPGEYITELTARLGLNSEMSMLDLGAGLGGPSRAINHAYGIWITAFEAVPEHVTTGMNLSVMHGMAKKVPLTEFDPHTIELPSRKYDCIFSKEMMHHVQDKKRLLAQITSALKPNGQFFIINYVVTDAGKGGPRMASWNQADGQVSDLWSKEDYVAAFSEVKLDLRVTDDLTQRYCTMIADGFRGLRKNMDSLIATEEDPERQSDLRRALAFESNRWAVRAEALQSGEVGVMRFSGTNQIKSEIR
jgi:cyclopropane fatty-acyl-phospholipid synthase-like methyltransferase